MKTWTGEGSFLTSPMTERRDGSFMVKFPLDGEDRFAYFHFPRALHGDEVLRVMEMIHSLVIEDERPGDRHGASDE